MNNGKTIWPFRLLRTFCPPQLLEEIEGDLLQRYEGDLKSPGHLKWPGDSSWLRAKRRLLWNVLQFFRPGILLRNRFSHHISSNMMFANFRFTLRHLVKQKSNSAIHVVGLSLGITSCLLIGLYIDHQAGFDSYHQNAKKVYRVNSIFTEGGINFDLYATPNTLSKTIQPITGVRQIAKTRALFKTVVEATPQKLFKEDRILIVEPSFLDLFDVKVLNGGFRKALNHPYQAILSQSTAKRFFGEADPVGKVIKLKKKFLFTVVGVMGDPPANTSLPAEILLSFIDAPELLDNGDTWFFGDFDWVKLQMSTFVMLDDGADVAAMQSQLKTIADKQINAHPHLSEKIRASFELQPLNEIHFDTEHFGGGPWVPAVNRAWLLFFAAIGAIILLLACVNFLNLSTAIAAVRAREVGIRKSIGAMRSQLIFQFLMEAFVLVVLATLFSLLMAMIMLNVINDLIGQHISIRTLLSVKGIGVLLCSVGLVVMLAGLYPAWLISKSRPIESLKANLLSSVNQAGGMLRQSLTAVQFIISGVLIIAVLVISRQVDFMRTKNLGFEKENVITIEVPNVKKAQVLAAELLNLPSIKDVSLSRTSPISNDHWWNSISLNSTADKRFSVCAIYGDENFYSFYGLKLVSGRIPTPSEFIPDSLRKEGSVYKVVVNEKLLLTLELGKPIEAVGKLFWWGGPAEIVGVVKDFNTEPLEYAIAPTIITQHPELFSQANIKLARGSNLTSTIASIEKVWKKNFPSEVFEVKFLDQQIHDFYRMENKVFQLFKVFAIVAICISCLGLWGLVTFMAHVRVKEIGIRKVFGASLKSIVVLFSKDVFATVAVAFIVAVPTAYFLLSELLTRVAYRVDISWDIFSLAGAILLSVVFLTISAQTIRSAKANPVNSLKNE